MWQWLSIAARQHELAARVDLARRRAADGAERRDDAVLDADVAKRRVAGGRDRAVADDQIVVGHLLQFLEAAIVACRIIRDITCQPIVCVPSEGEARAAYCRPGDRVVMSYRICNQPQLMTDFGESAIASRPRGRAPWKRPLIRREPTSATLSVAKRPSETRRNGYAGRPVVIIPAKERYWSVDLGDRRLEDRQPLLSGASSTGPAWRK